MTIALFQKMFRNLLADNLNGSSKKATKSSKTTSKSKSKTIKTYVDKAADFIKPGEGWEPRVYKCPADKWTIGYGFNVQEVNLPKPVAEYWLKYLIAKQYIPALRKIIIDFDSLDEPRKIALIDMCYNLGATRFKRFKNMINAINLRMWDEAAKEALNSKWAKQVGNRANKVAKILETGKIK